MTTYYLLQLPHKNCFQMTVQKLYIFEPVWLIGAIYFSLLFAESVHWSGIMAIIGCGLAQKRFVHWDWSIFLNMLSKMVMINIIPQNEPLTKIRLSHAAIKTRIAIPPSKYGNKNLRAMEKVQDFRKFFSSKTKLGSPICRLRPWTLLQFEQNVLDWQFHIVLL